MSTTKIQPAREFNDVDIPSRLGVIRPFDTSSVRSAYILECANGCQFKLSGRASEILELLWSGYSAEQTAARLRELYSIETTPAGIISYYERLESRIKDGIASHRDVPPGYTLKCGFLTANFVARAASLMTWMYKPAIAIAMLISSASVLGLWIACDSTLPHAAFQGGIVALGYALFLASVFLHELGHASACSRFGVKPGPIGFILYLTFPALYNDVSGTWRLKRWQRVVVDAAGSYFQLVVAAIYSGLFEVTQWLPYSVAVYMILISTVFNLNPLFKFDGYWIVSDALGVYNLGSRARKHILSASRSLFRQQNNDSKSERWPVWILYSLTIYGVAAIGAWSYFIFRLFASIPLVFGSIWHTARATLISGHLSGGDIFPTAFSLLTIYFATTFIVSTTKRFVKRLLPSVIIKLRHFG